MHLKITIAYFDKEFLEEYQQSIKSQIGSPKAEDVRYLFR